MLLFSLNAVPAPLQSSTPPSSFDAVEAAAVAHQLVKVAPDRTPGSDGDAAAADFVKDRFGQIRTAQVSEQPYRASIGDGDADLRNVLLTLPGDSDRSILVLAARDAAHRPGAASSAAATGALLQLADDLVTAQHSHTLILASTDGGTAGASGATELMAGLEDPDSVDAVIVLDAPGVNSLHQPLVVSTSDGDSSTASQLTRTAERVVEEQTGTQPDSAGPLAQLARLAYPSGLGQQAPLIDRGVSAVTISGAGEGEILPAKEDRSLSVHTLGELGRAALATTTAVDEAADSPEHGPGTYVQISGSLVPGWALGLLALSLLLPAAVVALEVGVRAARAGAAPGRAVAWAATRGLPLFAIAIAAWLLAVVGLLPRPPYPFDPRRFGVAASELLAMAFLILVGVATWFGIRRSRRADDLSRGAAVAGIGIASVAAVFAIWLMNPYLALLLVPAAHVWLLALRRRRASRLPLAVASLLALAAAALAAVYVGSRLGLGMEAPWRLLLMVGDGQIPLPLTFAVSIVIGCLASLPIAASRRGLDKSPIGPGVATADVIGEETQTKIDQRSRGKSAGATPDRPSRLPGGFRVRSERDHLEDGPGQAASPRPVRERSWSNPDI